MNKGNFNRVSYARFPVLKEALVVTHSKLSLELSEGLKSNTYNDDKRSTTEGEDARIGLSRSLNGSRTVIGVTGKDPLYEVLDHVRSCNNRKNCYYAEEQGTCKGDLVKNLLDIIRGGSALSDTGDSTTLLLEVVSNVYGIEGDLSVEVSKTNYKNEEYDRVNKAVRAEES